MFKLKKEFNICCSHRLNNESLSVNKNKQLFGKCNNLPSHGHNYRIILELKQETLDDMTGMIMNFDILKLIFKSIIDDRFDHHFLNNDRLFKNVVPTAENMCKIFYDLLKIKIPQLNRIEIYETEGSSAIYETPTSFATLSR